MVTLIFPMVLATVLMIIFNLVGMLLISMFVPLQIMVTLIGRKRLMLSKSIMNLGSM